MSQTKQQAREMAEKIVIEMLQYDNMDFNDEEQYEHDRRVTWVSDLLEQLLADKERLDWVVP